ncbi:MAG: FG-GAP-like repeat-containing protein [Candidatus Cloacimonetes bacterium]|nr:FG-GAP-like repeat-containing protein [Candidatus Cloacimonadota bacterium]
MSRVYLIAMMLMLSQFQMWGVNHLDIMNILAGEDSTRGMGNGLASLDFNGDNIQDLAIIQSKCPRPEHQGIYDYGRILLLYGGSNFDTTPDLELYGNPNDYFVQGTLLNAGDVNGDGFEDLVVIRKFLDPEYINSIWRLCIYYGGVNPSTEPSFQADYHNYYASGTPGINSLLPFVLGDINGDGYDDIGVVTFWEEPEHRKVEIFFGGSLAGWTIYDSYTEIYTYPMMNGVGDVNNDGYDDFILAYTTGNIDNQSNVVLYYGSPDITSSETVVLATDSSLDYQRKPMAAGDVNGDGNDDFLGRSIWNGSAAFGALWLGGENITATYDVMLNPNYFGTLTPAYGFVHGDLNGDGFDDLIGSDYSHWGGDGHVAIWLGKTNFNGTADLFLNSPDNIPGYSQFGYSMATGDFNNDGMCDLAIGAPTSPPGLSAIPGAVVVYNGNAQLSDTTVANEDELSPSLIDIWKLSTYPNPLHKGDKLNVVYGGDAYSKVKAKIITVYNLRGQVVFLATDASRSSAYPMVLPELPNGIYFLTVANGNNALATKKIILTK